MRIMSLAKDLTRKWASPNKINDNSGDVVISKNGHKYQGMAATILKKMSISDNRNPSVRVKLKDSGIVTHVTRQNLRDI